MSPSISVVVITWNSEADLMENLPPVAGLLSESDELIIVDNNSDKNPSDLIESISPNAKLILNPENIGFSEAFNQAVEVSSSEWLFLINPDAKPFGNFLRDAKELIKKLEPSVGTVQPIMFFKGETTVNSFGIQLTRTGGARDRYFGEPFNTISEGPIFSGTGGAVLYRKEMLDQARLQSGVFDREFFMYWEDADLGWRCQLLGWRAVACKQLRIEHAYQSSVKKLEAGFATKHIRMNRAISLGKNASLVFLIFCLPRTIVDCSRILLKQGQGLKGLIEYKNAFLYGLRQRNEVSGKTIVSRREVEKRWAGAK